MNKLNKLIGQLEELATKISQQDIVRMEVSKSNVGWHIEHILLTINIIIEEVKKSNPINYKWSFKLTRVLVLAMKKIPRGRAKAPKVVAPKKFDEKTLKEHLEITKSKIQDLETISSNKYFNHPFFGNLKLDKTLKFLEIHTNHHLEIINDILNGKT
ncbi:MAG: DUF1569 domain-containing protein [Flavobacteriales bacterium]|nr:DUF1569 domain-containing protein [Flavobacteriales bacterium]